MIDVRKVLAGGGVVIVLLWLLGLVSPQVTINNTGTVGAPTGAQSPIVVSPVVVQQPAAAPIEQTPALSPAEISPYTSMPQATIPEMVATPTEPVAPVVVEETPVAVEPALYQPAEEPAPPVEAAAPVTQPERPIEWSPDGNYTVQPGDSLSRIAQALGVDAERLARANNIPDPNDITAGDVLVPPQSRLVLDAPPATSAPEPEATPPPEPATTPAPTPVETVAPGSAAAPVETTQPSPPATEPPAPQQPAPEPVVAVADPPVPEPAPEPPSAPQPEPAPQQTESPYTSATQPQVPAVLTPRFAEVRPPLIPVLVLPTTAPDLITRDGADVDRPKCAVCLKGSSQRIVTASQSTWSWQAVGLLVLSGGLVVFGCVWRRKGVMSARACSAPSGPS